MMTGPVDMSSERINMPPTVVVHTACDTESYAAAWNDGYETAVTQGIADDPMLADDWFQAKLREAKAEALRELADDFSVNLTVMSGPRIRRWITRHANEYKADGS